MAGKDQVNSGSGLMETAYLAKMMRSVVFIDTNNPELGRGSGCIVGLPDSGPMLLACHHLLPSKDVAINSTIYFDRENRDSPGVGISGAELFDLNSGDSFITNFDLDYALIAMNPSQIPGEERERFYLHQHQRVSSLKEMDIVHLLHYPFVDGAHTLCSSAGTVKFLSGYLLGCCIESTQGSAGGPVVKEVDGAWVVVGLHRGRLAINNSETKVATHVEAIHRTMVDGSYRPPEPDWEMIKLRSEPDLEKIQLASALDDKPSEIQLMSVSREVGGKWKAVLVYLEIKKNKIDSILQTAFGNVENACFEGLVYWRSGNASQPVTWRTLFQSLRKAGLDEETKELKKTFNIPLDEADNVEEEASQESSSVADVITGPSDFLPYMEVLIPHLTLLGTVLGIEDYTSAVMEGAGSLRDKCIKILSHWLSRTPNPTWRGFCQKLEKAYSFNQLRYRISTDRSTFEDKLSSVPGSSEVDAQPSWLEQYQKAVEQQGSVTLNIIRCVVIGPPNVGKSCLKHLLIHDEPKKVTTSTPVMESPDVVTFDPEDNSSSSDEEDFTSNLCVADVGSSSNWSLITPDDMGQMVKKCSVEGDYDSPVSFPLVITETKETLTDGESVLPRASTSPVQAPDVPSPMLPHIMPSVSPTAHKTTMLADLMKAKDDLLRDIGAKDGNVHFPLNKLNLIHMFDSGGQLAFQDTLPLLVNTPCTFLTVFNASLDLDEPMDITYRSQDGSEAKLDHKLTQWEMMLRTFSSIHAMECKCHEQIKAVLQEGSSLPPSSIIVVGTHKDALEKHPKRKDIEGKIKSSIELMRKSKPYCLSGPKRHFLINALTKHESSDKDLRKSLSNKKNALSLKLPLTWLLVELTTQRHKQKFIPYNELKEFCLQAGYISPKDTDKQFLSLLLVLHNLGFYAFYDLKGVSKSSNWVCTDAATLYREVSKLLVVQYMEEPSEEATCEFKEYGIIKEDTIQELFNELDILPIIDPGWFINVLMHIGIAARLKVEEGECQLFFIPLALPFHRTDLPSTTSVSGLCFTLEFPGKRVPFSKPTVTELPRGIFPHLAVYLCDQHLEEDDIWQIDAENSDRKHIKFTNKDSAIYLIEHPGHIEVAILLYEPFFLSVSGNEVSKIHGLCQELCKTITTAIVNMCNEVFGKDPSKHPVVRSGFQCPRSKGSDTPHLAIVNEDCASAKCSVKCALPFILDPHHRIWFSGDLRGTKKFTRTQDGIWIMEGTTAAFEDNSPSDASLQRVVQEIGGWWPNVAILLGVPAQYVTAKDSSPLAAFLHWRNSSSKSLLPPTWKSLFDAVRSTPQLGPRMAERLKASVS